MGKRHHNPRWRALAKRAKRRDGWRCRKCGSHWPLEVHHHDTRPDRFFDLAAVTTLCRGCHIRLHRGPRKRVPGRAAWDRLVEELRGQSQAEIVGPVFGGTVAEFLGIRMPTVAVGDAGYQVLETRPTVAGPFAASEDAADTTGTITATVLEPERIQAEFFYRRRDRKRLAGMDEALRSALSSGIREKMDYEVLRGDAGLLTGTILDNHNRASVTDYAAYVSQFAFGRVDGRWADTVGALRIVMGAGTYAHAATVYRGQSTEHALERLIADTAGVRVSAHVPIVANSKQNSVIRLGSREDAVMPIWEGVEIEEDRVTKLISGEIRLVAIAFVNFKVLRKAGFYKQQTQHA